METTSYLLCGDIGGTNGRLQMWSFVGSKLLNQYSHNYRMAEFVDLSSLLIKCLSDSKQPRVHACALAICGPVWEEGRRSAPNNLFHSDGTPWPNLNAEDHERALQLPEGAFIFVNDFEAIGYGITMTLDTSPVFATCQSLIASSIHTLYSAPAQKGKPVACFGAGTGLGAVYLTCIPPDHKYHVFPSETGMCNIFSPENELECQLKLYLQKKYGKHIEVERIVSGPGLVNVYNFLLEFDPTTHVITDVSRAIASADPDLRPAIVTSNAKNGDITCLAALDLFIDVYARFANTMACSFLPYSGLFIAGGILPKVMWRAAEKSGEEKHCRFVKRYLEVGVMSEMVACVPLHVISCDEIGTFGSLYRSLQLLEKIGNST